MRIENKRHVVRFVDQATTAVISVGPNGIYAYPSIRVSILRSIIL